MYVCTPSKFAENIIIDKMKRYKKRFNAIKKMGHTKRGKMRRDVEARWRKNDG
jgi:hypothetical protein